MIYYIYVPKLLKNKKGVDFIKLFNKIVLVNLSLSSFLVGNAFALDSNITKENHDKLDKGSLVVNEVDKTKNKLVDKIQEVKTDVFKQKEKIKKEQEIAKQKEEKKTKEKKEKEERDKRLKEKLKDSYIEGSGSSVEAFKKIVDEYKIDAEDVDKWAFIINKESGWNFRATNPSSGAYGLPQSLPGNKMSAFGDDWETNPYTQLKWMLDYMNSRYGSIDKAYKFWNENHWY